jgi:hypothetical protein
MKNRKLNVVASIAVLSLLLLGIAPVFAQPNQSSATTESSAATQSSTTTQTSTTSQTTSASSNQASVLIALAQAAQNYVQQLITIAQGQGVGVSQAQSLLSQGTQSLTLAQSELSTNPTQAAKDALQAMTYFRSAAESVKSAIQASNGSQEVAQLQATIQRMDGRATQLQAAITKACAVTGASASVCSDATSNLATATSDLSQATGDVAALPNPPTQAAIQAIQSLLTDAQNHLQQAYTDLGNLATNAREQQAVDMVQNVLLPFVTSLEQKVQSSNLGSAAVQQYEADLSQAQALLNSAITSFQSGNFANGLQQVQQANALVIQVEMGLLQSHQTTTSTTTTTKATSTTTTTST